MTWLNTTQAGVAVRVRQSSADPAERNLYRGGIRALLTARPETMIINRILINLIPVRGGVGCVGDIDRRGRRAPGTRDAACTRRRERRPAAPGAYGPGPERVHHGGVQLRSAGAEPRRPEQAHPAAEVDPAPPGRSAVPGRLAGTRSRRLPRRPADVRARHARGGREPAPRSRVPAPPGARVAHRAVRAARHPRPCRGGVPGTDRGGPDPAADPARRTKARLLHGARQGDDGVRRRRHPRGDLRPHAAEDDEDDHRAGRPVGRAQARPRSRGGVRPRRGLRGAGVRRRADPRHRSPDRGGLRRRAGRPDALGGGERGRAQYRGRDLERQPQPQGHRHHHPAVNAGPAG